MKKEITQILRSRKRIDTKIELIYDLVIEAQKAETKRVINTLLVDKK